MPLIGDGIADDSAAMQAAINSALAANATFRVPSGIFSVGPQTIDLSSSTDEPVVVRGRIDMLGEGLSSTVLRGRTPGARVLSVLGGTDVASHVYSSIGHMSFGPEAAGNTAIYIKNASQVAVADVLFSGMNLGLELESVLSSSFERMTFRWCSVGASLKKGTGFSGINAVSFSDCSWGGNTALAVNGYDFTTNITFTGCEVEGNGRQGQAFDGGIVLAFSGIEGGVGANFNGCYFEGNGGAFDVRLVNGGANYMSHTFIGCNFNRISSSKFVTNNISSIGKNLITFIGCSFRGYGSYVPDASRKYVGGDGLQVVKCIGCDFGSSVEQGGLANI